MSVPSSTPARKRRWGEWRVGVQFSRDGWAFGFHRIAWLGINALTIGRLVVSLTHPVWFTDDAEPDKAVGPAPAEAPRRHMFPRALTA